MNIAIYARVSSEKQAKDGTIESQLEALKEYAKAHDLNIAYECLDDGYSGTVLARPGLDELRDLAQARSIEGVLILSPDRLSRNQANQILLMEEFKKRNLKVIFTNQQFEDTPEGNFMLQIHGAVAELERAKIVDRMRRGTIHAVKNGQINGGNRPYGYRYVPKNKNVVGHLEIHPEEAKTVRYIFDLYINERLAGTQIEKRLNDELVPCRGNKWWSSLIYQILKSETYTGTAYMFKRRRVEPTKNNPKMSGYRKEKNSSRVFRGRDEWNSIPVPVIIDETTWNKAQELLKQNAHKSKRNNRKNEYLLRGLVVCGLCGALASGYVSNKSTYYSCGAKRNKNIHSKPHDELIQTSHKPFDESIWLGLTQLLSDPNKLKSQVEKRLQMRSAKVTTHQDTTDLDKELAQLANQEKRILDAYREAVISLDELKTQKEKIFNRCKVLEGKKDAVLSHSEGTERAKITMGMLGDVSARFSRVMAKADFATREILVNRLVNSVTLMTDKAIVRGNIPIDTLDALNPSRQSVHLTGGILRHFRAFSTPKQNPALEVLSTPARPQVTQTVVRFAENTARS
jgi:site-specific DNA recombinase